jgi:hypothetical protein
MAVRPTALINPKFASTTMALEYTAASGVVILDRFTATNNSAGAVTLTVHVVPPSGAIAADNLVINAIVIASGETRAIVGLMGHVLQSGAALWCQTTAGSALVLYASGRVIA